MAASLEQEQSERNEDSNSARLGGENFSSDDQIEICSNRGLSQLLPTQLQNDLAEQHIIFQRSSNPELGTQEIELQTQVVDVELEEESEAEVNGLPDYEEQVPEEAVEVTVWSSVDESLANHDHIHYGSSEMVNQCSLSDSGQTSAMNYAITKRTVVLSSEKEDVFSRELFSQEKVVPSTRTASQEQAVRTLGATQTVYTLDVATVPSLDIAGSSLSLFSAPSSGERQQIEQAAVTAVVRPSSPVSPELPDRPIAKKSPAKPIPFSSVIPPKPLYSLPSFLTNLSSLVASAVWFKKTPRKRDRNDTSRVEGGGSPRKIAKVVEVQSSQGFATESDTEAEMVGTYNGSHRMEALSSSEDEDNVKDRKEEMEVENGEQDVGNKTRAEKVGDCVHSGKAFVDERGGADKGVTPSGSSEVAEEKVEVEVEASQNTLIVDVEGSYSPGELVIVSDGSKDSTGNITMGTPQYSQPPFQPGITSALEAVKDKAEASTEQLVRAEDSGRAKIVKRGEGVDHTAAAAAETRDVLVMEVHEESDSQEEELEEKEIEELAGGDIRDIGRRGVEEVEMEVEETIHGGVAGASTEEGDQEDGDQEDGDQEDGQELLEEISAVDSQEDVVNAAFVSSPSTTTVDTTGQSDSTNSPRKKQSRRKSLKRKVRRSAFSIHPPHFQSASSAESRSHLPSSSSHSLCLRAPSNTPPEIAAIIHSTYMSAALQNSRLTETHLTDLWRLNSS